MNSASDSANGAEEVQSRAANSANFMALQRRGGVHADFWGAEASPLIESAYRVPLWSSPLIKGAGFLRFGSRPSHARTRVRARPCVHARTHARTHARMRMRTHACARVHTHTRTHARVRTCTRMHARVRTHTHVYAYTRARVRKRVFIRRGNPRLLAPGVALLTFSSPGKVDTAEGRLEGP